MTAIARRAPTRPALFAGLILTLLGGCGTPQEQCIARNTRDLRTLDRLIGESQGNLARGYAYETVEITRTRWVRCYDPQPRLPDGTVPPPVARMCLDDVSDTIRRPVAIDLAAEKAKLAGMQRKRAELERAAGPLIAACKAQYPE